MQILWLEDEFKGVNQTRLRTRKATSQALQREARFDGVVGRCVGWPHCAMSLLQSERLDRHGGTETEDGAKSVARR